jgi:hypothetical protein
MSGERPDNRLWKAVATLPAVVVDEAHAARVQAHCRRALERNRRPGRNRANVRHRADSGDHPSDATLANAVTVAMLWVWSVWHTLVRMAGRDQQTGRPGFPVSGSARS